MQTIRIAAITSLSIVGDMAGNMARTAHWTRLAKDAGVELACFPELNITGYCLDPREMSSLAQPIPGPLSDELSRLARETEMIILAGMAEKNPHGQPYISHCLLQPNGDVAVYRKLHLSPHENPVFEKGGTIPIFQTEKICFGIQLCYDAHFPELATAMTNSGAEVLFMPHASPRTNAQIKHQSWMRHLPARAYDNSLFVVACNQWGDNHRGLSFPGNAAVIDPSGNVIQKKITENEEMLVTDLTQEALSHARNHPMRHFFPNRRPELYGQPSAIE